MLMTDASTIPSATTTPPPPSTFEPVTPSALPDAEQVTERGSAWGSRATHLMLGVLRIALGWLLFWAGLDKIFGLGLSTQSGQGIVDGASATEGYLQFGINPDGPAYDLLSSLAGNPILDVLYLAATVGAGLALMLGVVVRVAAIGGGALMLMLWLSSLPLEFNPFMDQHFFYVLVAITVAVSGAGRYLGLGRWWSSTPLVKSQRWLA